MQAARASVSRIVVRCRQGASGEEETLVVRLLGALPHAKGSFTVRELLCKVRERVRTVHPNDLEQLELEAP